jgi:hypothetical protein
VGRGDHSFFGRTARTPGSVKGAKERARAGTRLSGLSEGLPSAVVDLHDPGAKHLAARNVVVGRQPEPGTEVLAGRKAGHVGADFRNDGLGHGLGDPDNVDQIDAEQGTRCARTL